MMGILLPSEEEQKGGECGDDMSLSVNNQTGQDTGRWLKNTLQPCRSDSNTLEPPSAPRRLLKNVHRRVYSAIDALRRLEFWRHPVPAFEVRAASCQCRLSTWQAGVSLSKRTWLLSSLDSSSCTALNPKRYSEII